MMRLFQAYVVVGGMPGVALSCYNVKEPVPPLEGNGNHSLFKLFLSDTGLLCTASMGGIQYDLLQGNLDVNMGAIMENVVAQELRAHGFDLYYFNTNRLGEVDFMVQSGRIVLPVEVKSGNDWTKHKALDNVLAVDDWALNKAYVLCKGNVRQDGRITYLPLYMSMFLETGASARIDDLRFGSQRLTTIGEYFIRTKLRLVGIDQ